MKAIRRLSLVLPLSAGLMFLAGSAVAAPYITNPDTCKDYRVTINTIEKSPLDGQEIIYPTETLGAPIDATSCFGVIAGNDHQGGLSAPDPNIGQLNDGLLNGEGGLISPLQFITQDQLLDLDGDGTATDPGWIFLGDVQQGRGFSAYDKPLDISTILDFTLLCTGSGGDACTSGTWSLETELNIIDIVQKELGRNAFDHLALVIKASNRYAIYDFDFNILAPQFLAAGGDFDFETPYSFTGTWNTQDFLNKKGKPQDFSHISLWVRDPLVQNDVPTPGTLALLGAGLLLLGVGRYRA